MIKIDIILSFYKISFLKKLNKNIRMFANI